MFRNRREIQQRRKTFKSVCNLSPHSHNLLIPQTENISNMLLIGCEMGHIRMLQVFAFNRKSNKPKKKYLFQKHLFIHSNANEHAEGEE